VGLKLMGANSTGNSLFVLSTGTSKFEDSVWLLLKLIILFFLFC
jgi:hypothetical protein